MPSLIWEAPSPRIDDVNETEFALFVQDLNTKLLSMPNITRNTTVTNQLDINTIPVLGYVATNNTFIAHKILVYELNFPKPSEVNQLDWINKIYLKIEFRKYKVSNANTNANASYILCPFIEIGNRISTSGVWESTYIITNSTRTQVSTSGTASPSPKFIKNHNSSYLFNNNKYFTLIHTPDNRQGFDLNNNPNVRKSIAIFLAIEHCGNNYNIHHSSFTNPNETSMPPFKMSNIDINNIKIEYNSTEHPIIGGDTYSGIKNGKIQYRQVYFNKADGDAQKSSQLLFYKNDSVNKGEIITINNDNYFHLGDMNDCYSFGTPSQPNKYGTIAIKISEGI